MPALDSVPTLPGSGVTQTELDTCIGIAERMPLVRVIVPTNDRGPIEVREIFAEGLLRRRHKSDKARALEVQLGAGDALYFHAGRTHPQYGLAVLVIAELVPAVEVTPFGLGGLCCPNNDSSPLHTSGSCVAPVAHLDPDAQRSFVQASIWGNNWRAQFGQYLVWYFGTAPERYFQEAEASRPVRPDPEGIFTELRNHDWRSWTAEVRALEDVSVSVLIDKGSLLFWGVHESVEQTMKRDAYVRRTTIHSLYPIWAKLPRSLRLPIEAIPGTDRFADVDRAIQDHVL